ncbi:transcriptional regulator BetI [Methylobacterium pseudosasicola]|uniref:HTH-type transcriptional regulator BetI n=1 Tax=Methylobacterium pseudosasicola TaxID=582667 RepID=A0A1I4GVX5_9HYPH|nr:transcriptional regulator BetI [Methylobacterium pseudosasicola]SFL34079.1 transcriptional regulator, TetR family [Methylobacterium pseudosasicola]
MTSSSPMQTFEAARRRHLVEATIETLAEVGFKAASLSEIARRANVSAGLFAHYFGDKDGLLEATLRFMAARLASATARKLAASRTRRERLYAVCDAALADEEFDRRTSAVWLAFWSQMAHSKRYQRIQAIYQRRMITNLRHGLRGLVADPCLSLHATMIAAMIDGLWLRSHVMTATPREAGPDGAAVRAVVHAFIDGLLAGGDGAAEAGAPRPICVTPPCAPRETVWHLSPVTGEEIARFLPAGPAEIRGAVHDARQGLAAWRAVGGAERARVLYRCAEFLRAEGPDLARLETRETGRPIRHTGGSDLPDAIRTLEYAAGLAERTGATRTDLGMGRFGHRRQEPRGVAAAFGHWSAAILGLCEQAVALAYGNAVVFAADPGATQTSLRLADLFGRAGLPEGALTVLCADGETARLLRADPGLLLEPDDADATSDRDLGAGLGRSKAATIVLPGCDAPRVAAALLHGGRRWLRSTFAGQARVYVHAEARVALRRALQAAAARMRVGDPLDPATEVGPAHSPAHAAGLDAALRADLEAGAELIYGGGRRPGPIILDRCTNAMALVRGHSFAPIVALVPFSDEAALGAGLANPGLRAGIFAGDPDRAWRMANALDAAFCAINDCATGSDAGCPPGGSAAFADWSVSADPDRSLSRIARIVSQEGPLPA